MKDLRHQVIRLAHNNPELRPHLLPLLEETTPDASPKRLKGFNSVASHDKEEHTAKELLVRLREIKDRTGLVIGIIHSTHQSVSRSVYPPTREMNVIYKRLVGAAHQLVENCYLIEIYLGARGFRLASQSVADRIQYRSAIKAIDEMLKVQQEINGVFRILQQTSQSMLPLPSGSKYVSEKFNELISDCHTLLEGVITYVKLYAAILDDAS